MMLSDGSRSWRVQHWGLACIEVLGRPETRPTSTTEMSISEGKISEMGCSRYSTQATTSSVAGLPPLPPTTSQEAKGTKWYCLHSPTHIPISKSPQTATHTERDREVPIKAGGVGKGVARLVPASRPQMACL